MLATYTRLRSGEWGIRITEHTVGVGDTVAVVKRDGTRSSETIKEIVWSGDGVTVASVQPKERGGRQYRSVHGLVTAFDDGCIVTDDGMQLWEDA